MAGRRTNRPARIAAWASERDGDRNAGAEQEDQEEDATGALRQNLDAVMQIDAVDRVIAQKCHGRYRKESTMRDASPCGLAGKCGVSR